MAMFPFAVKGARAMVVMQTIKPEMDKLKLVIETAKAGRNANIHTAC